MNLLLKLVLIAMGVAASAAALSQEAMPEHEHKMVQMPEGIIEPALELKIHRDSKSGFNLEIITHNFELEPPESANEKPGKILEGHAHVFINGQKVCRAYGRYIHLPENLFGDGIQQIMVSLNDHEHNTYSRGEKMVMSTLVVNKNQENYLVHSHNFFSPAGDQY